MTVDSSAPDTRRSVRLTRTGPMEYLVENPRGGVITIGEGYDAHFSPVELLLAALGGCNAVTVEALTKRSEPELFDVAVEAHKTTAADRGTQLEDIRVTFDVRFSCDEDGQKMTERLPDAIEKSHHTYCTVSRTIESGTPVTIERVEVAY